MLAGNPDPMVWIYWGTTDGGTNAAAWAHTNLWPAPQSVGYFSTNITAPDLVATITSSQPRHASCRIRPDRRDRGPVGGARDAVRVKSLR